MNSNEEGEALAFVNEYRATVTQSTRSTNDLSQYHYNSPATIEVTMPQDQFFRMAKLVALVRKVTGNHRGWDSKSTGLSKLWSQYIVEGKIRRDNPAVQDAYNQYQMLVALHKEHK